MRNFGLFLVFFGIFGIFLMLLGLVGTLATSAPQYNFHIWDKIYDPYMKTAGYALNYNRDTISKNNIDLVHIANCFRCDPETDLFPYTLRESIVKDFTVNFKLAQDQYNKDLLNKLNLTLTTK